MQIKTNQKGITLTSLVAYMSILMIVIAAMTTMSTFFFSNVSGVVDTPKYLSEFNKFTMFFVTDIKNYTAANVTPLQTYYERNAHYYNIFKNHRSLIIAQFFGLLTCDSHTYEKEETTQAYNCIVNENEQENLNKYKGIDLSSITNYNIAGGADAKGDTVYVSGATRTTRGVLNSLRALAYCYNTYVAREAAGE